MHPNSSKTLALYKSCAHLLTYLNKSEVLAEPHGPIWRLWFHFHSP